MHFFISFVFVTTSIFISSTAFAHNPDAYVPIAIGVGSGVVTVLAGLVFLLSKNIALAKTMSLIGLGLIGISILALFIMTGMDVVTRDPIRPIELNKANLLS